MNADMIPNESIVEEVISLEEGDDPVIDFAEGINAILLYCR